MIRCLYILLFLLASYPPARAQDICFDLIDELESFYPTFWFSPEVKLEFLELQKVLKVKQDRLLSLQKLQAKQKNDKLWIELKETEAEVSRISDELNQIKGELYSHVPGTYKRGIPYGFRDYEDFSGFRRLAFGTLEKSFNLEKDPDFSVYLGGSSITGLSFAEKAENSLRRPMGDYSDFDVAVEIPDRLFDKFASDQRLKKLGFTLRSGKRRTGPLKEPVLRELGLFETIKELSNNVGREVNLMLFKPGEVANRGVPYLLLYP